VSYTLTCLPMFFFFVSSSMVANIASSSMTIYPVNVRALIQPFLHDGRQRGRQTQVRKTLRYDLSAKKQLQDCCIEELEVLHFFCLDLGCQHERGEVYLSSGYLDSIPATERCTLCPICNQRYHKDFLPVY